MKIVKEDSIELVAFSELIPGDCCSFPRGTFPEYTYLKVQPVNGSNCICLSDECRQVTADPHTKVIKLDTVLTVRRSNDQ